VHEAVRFLSAIKLNSPPWQSVLRILITFDADPDPAFHFDPDLTFSSDPDPDPTFPSDADPDRGYTSI
jgi:hypothetical protein